MRHLSTLLPVILPVILPVMLPASFLVGQDPPQRVSGLSPEQERALAPLHAEFLQLIARAQELRALQHPGPPTAEQERELGAAMARMKTVALELFALSSAAPPHPAPSTPTPHPESPTPERPLTMAEEVLRQWAESRIRGEFQTAGAKRFREEAIASRCSRAILLDNPALAVFPDHRFYLAELELVPKSGKGPDGTEVPSRLRRFVYQLALFDARSGEVTVRWGFGPWLSLELLIDRGLLRAPTRAAAVQIHGAREFLWRASGGRAVFRAIGEPGLGRAEIDQRYGLGQHLAAHDPGPFRVVETAAERLLLSWQLRADDWGMPQQLVCELLRFDVDGGAFRDRTVIPRGMFESDATAADPAVRDAIDALEAELKRDR